MPPKTTCQHPCFDLRAAAVVAALRLPATSPRLCPAGPRLTSSPPPVPRFACSVRSTFNAAGSSEVPESASDYPTSEIDRQVTTLPILLPLILPLLLPLPLPLPLLLLALMFPWTTHVCSPLAPLPSLETVSNKIPWSPEQQAVQSVKRE